jgi:hypothetical protein
MAFYEEYNDFFKELGPIGTAGYKFFDAFKVDSEKKTISFHKDYEVILEDETLLNEFRNFLKQEKKSIRTLQKECTLKEVKRKMGFFFMKLQENGIFEVSERKYILIYCDFCLENLLAN